MKHKIQKGKLLEEQRVYDLCVAELVQALSARLRCTNGIEFVPEKELAELKWQLNRAR